MLSVIAAILLIIILGPAIRTLIALIAYLFLLAFLLFVAGTIVYFIVLL